MMFMSDNPVQDAEDYITALDIRLARRPQCHCCGEYIQDEEGLHYRTSAFEIWLCLYCIENNMEIIEVD